MKYYTYVSLVLFLLAQLRCSNSSELKGSSTSNNINLNREDDFSNAILMCFKDKDYSSFSNFVISKEEGLSLFSKSDFTKEEIIKYKSDFEENHKIILAKSHSDFNQIITNGEKDGLVWENIKYKSHKFHIKDEHNLKSARVSINFEYKGSLYEISFDEVIKSEHGWRSVGSFSYNNHLNENTFEGSPQEVSDSLAKHLEDVKSK